MEEDTFNEGTEYFQSVDASEKESGLGPGELNEELSAPWKVETWDQISDGLKFSNSFLVRIINCCFFQHKQWYALLDNHRRLSTLFWD